MSIEFISFVFFMALSAELSVVAYSIGGIKDKLDMIVHSINKLKDDIKKEN